MLIKSMPLVNWAWTLSKRLYHVVETQSRCYAHTPRYCDKWPILAICWKKKDANWWWNRRVGVCGKSWDVVIKDAWSVSKTSNVVMSELTSTAVSDFPAFVRLKDKYKQELVEDGRLNKAADVAASREVLLTSHEPDAWKEPQLKAVGHELRQWVKCVRQAFGNLESPGANAAMEDGGASPLNHMMAQLVKNAASGQSPIKTPPNCRLPKRSRIPTPVVTPWTRKAKK